jgi:nucleoid-associated protein YgaU
MTVGGPTPIDSKPRDPVTTPLTPAPTIASTPQAIASVRGSSGNAPQVESFDEEMVVVQAGETFESISERVYHTRKYAQALQLFNRNDSLLSDMGRDNELKQGQTISLPPAYILEKRYSHVIPDLTQVRPGAPADPSRKIGIPTPPAVSYQVAAPGETMREIARKQLGNGERWNEIARLNPSYRPEYQVPAGTVLQLPGDAKPTP